MAMNVRECCCGCSLRSGTIIIGILGLVVSFLETVQSSYDLYSLSTDVNFKSYAFVKEKQLLRDIYQVLKVVSIIGIVNWAVQSILNAMLLIGVFKEKRILVSVWIIAYAVICGLMVLGLVITFFMFIFDLPVQVAYQVPFQGAFQVALGIGIVLQLYFLLVVWSFHKSPEAGYNRVQCADNVHNTDNYNTLQVPLDKPI